MSQENVNVVRERGDGHKVWDELQTLYARIVGGAHEPVPFIHGVSLGDGTGEHELARHTAPLFTDMRT